MHNLLLKLLVFLLISTSVHAQDPSLMVGGVLHGEYEDFYDNGQRKVSGTFENNQKVGKWTLWDSLGNERMVRMYTNNHVFSVISAKNANGEPMSYSFEIDPQTRHRHGYIEHPVVSEKDVLYVRRLWRLLLPGERNALFFEEDRLFEALRANVLSEEPFQIYVDDEFQNIISSEFRTELMDNQWEIVGYQIKEDWFYDAKRACMNVRLVGIAPVIREESGYRVLFWLYYPFIRSHLSLTSSDSHPTFDDALYARAFDSCIIQEGERFPNAFELEELERRTREITRELLSTEFNFWLQSTEQ